MKLVAVIFVLCIAILGCSNDYYDRPDDTFVGKYTIESTLHLFEPNVIVIDSSGTYQTDDVDHEYDFSVERHCSFFKNERGNRCEVQLMGSIDDHAKVCKMQISSDDKKKGNRTVLDEANLLKRFTFIEDRTGFASDVETAPSDINLFIKFIVSTLENCETIVHE